jgi:putative redox protein
MKINVSQVDRMHFTATTQSGHSVDMDGSAEVGGQNKGARPMEVVLAGLGGCSAIDVMSILEKSRQNPSYCEIEIDANRANTVPGVFSKIHLHYRVSGNQLDEKKVARAISLSMDKYCSVTRMLEKTAVMSYDFEVVED